MTVSTKTSSPQIKTELPGPRAREVLAKDAAFVSPSYTRDFPLVVQRGNGAMLEDVDGNLFLDFNAGVAVCVTGHCHPEIVAAISQQSRELIHISGTDYYYPLLTQLAEKLNSVSPGDEPKKIHFGNSGAEAVEGAIKVAFWARRRPKLIAFFNCFHGRTLGALSLTSSRAAQRRGFGAQALDVTHIPYANCYRCPYGTTPDKCAVECAKVIEDRLFKTTVPPDECAAIVVEPVQGEGGYIPAPKKFLEELRRIANENNVLLIFDEVQSGMGRTGKLWASEHSGVIPDVMSAAKGIASGLPLGATIARADLMDWPYGSHASTFGGNPVAIAASLKTFQILERELLQNCRERGEQLMNGLRELQKKHESIGDVRGLGLMIGIEFVKDRETKEPAVDLRNKIIQECFKRGLVILGAGDSTIRFSPPLVIDYEQAETALRIFDESIVASLS
ncbi:MAG TPA: acetyl ornithine aminotransferase family protein [Blastocatellia bacterium]|nr:acetyl ornithine aminotransferase family protein [Blastocatellia bacterium]